MTTPTQDLLNQRGPDTKLSDISWHDLPEELHTICWEIIDAWYSNVGVDRLRDMSDLNDMTLAELLDVFRARRRHRLIAFIRVDSEDGELLTYEQACAEKDQQELMCPENIYRIEEITPP